MLHAITFSLALLCQQEDAVPAPPPTVWELLQSKYDTNQDFKISAKEHGRGELAFSNLDADGDGFITQADLETPTWGPRGRSSKRKNKVRNKLVLPPKVGELAPDFELRVLLHEQEKASKVEKDSAKKEKVETIRLSSFAGEKPVALIFGSYT